MSDEQQTAETEFFDLDAAAHTYTPTGVKKMLEKAQSDGRKIVVTPGVFARMYKKNLGSHIQSAINRGWIFDLDRTSFAGDEVPVDRHKQFLQSGYGLDFRVRDMIGDYDPADIRSWKPKVDSAYKIGWTPRIARSIVERLYPQDPRSAEGKLLRKGWKIYDEKSPPEAIQKMVGKGTVPSSIVIASNMSRLGEREFGDLGGSYRVYAGLDEAKKAEAERSGALGRGVQFYQVPLASIPQSHRFDVDEDSSGKVRVSGKNSDWNDLFKPWMRGAMVGQIGPGAVPKDRDPLEAEFDYLRNKYKDIDTASGVFRIIGEGWQPGPNLLATGANMLGVGKVLSTAKHVGRLAGAATMSAAGGLKKAQQKAPTVGAPGQFAKNFFDAVFDSVYSVGHSIHTATTMNEDLYNQAMIFTPEKTKRIGDAVRNRFAHEEATGKPGWKAFVAAIEPEINPYLQAVNANIGVAIAPAIVKFGLYDGLSSGLYGAAEYAMTGGRPSPKPEAAGEGEPKPAVLQFGEEWRKKFIHAPLGQIFMGFGAPQAMFEESGMTPEGAAEASGILALAAMHYTNKYFMQPLSQKRTEKLYDLMYGFDARWRRRMIRRSLNEWTEQELQGVAEGVDFQAKQLEANGLEPPTWMKAATPKEKVFGFFDKIANGCEQTRQIFEELYKNLDAVKYAESLKDLKSQMQAAKEAMKAEEKASEIPEEIPNWPIRIESGDSPEMIQAKIRYNKGIQTGGETGKVNRDLNYEKALREKSAEDRAIREKLLKKKKEAEDAEGISGDEGQPTEAGSPVKGGQEARGDVVEQTPSRQPEPVAKGKEAEPAEAAAEKPIEPQPVPAAQVAPENPIEPVQPTAQPETLKPAEPIRPKEYPRTVEGINTKYEDLQNEARQRHADTPAEAELSRQAQELWAEAEKISQKPPTDEASWLADSTKIKELEARRKDILDRLERSRGDKGKLLNDEYRRLEAERVAELDALEAENKVKPTTEPPPDLPPSEGQAVIEQAGREISRAEQLFSDIQADKAQSPTPKKIFKRIAKRLFGDERMGIESRVARVNLDDIHLDPKRFQYRIEVDEMGLTDRFKDVDVWDPEAAGQILVWRDPANNKLYVVEGHHRTGIARRASKIKTDRGKVVPWSGKKQVAITEIKADTAREARAVAALLNIKGDRGTPMDAARFFRDTLGDESNGNMVIGKKLSDLQNGLRSQGTSLRLGTIQKAIKLSRLTDVVFHDIINKRYSEDIGEVIGEHIRESRDAQEIVAQEVIKEIQKTGVEPSKEWTKQMCYTVLRGMKATTQQPTAASGDLIGGMGEPAGGNKPGDLFGGIRTEAVSTHGEAASIQANVATRLKLDKQYARMVDRAKFQQFVENLGGNDLPIEEAKKVKTESDLMLHLFDTESKFTGPLTDIVDRYALELNQKPGERQRIMEDAYNEISAYLRKMAGIGDAGPVPPVGEPQRPGFGRGQAESTAGEPGGPQSGGATLFEYAQPGARPAEPADAGARPAERTGEPATEKPLEPGDVVNLDMGLSRPGQEPPGPMPGDAPTMQPKAGIGGPQFQTDPVSGAKTYHQAPEIFKMIVDMLANITPRVEIGEFIKMRAMADPRILGSLTLPGHGQRGLGELLINRESAKDPSQLARTLGHEIGHFIHWYTQRGTPPAARGTLADALMDTVRSGAQWLGINPWKTGQPFTKAEIDGLRQQARDHVYSQSKKLPILVQSLRGFLDGIGSAIKNHPTMIDPVKKYLGGLETEKILDLFESVTTTGNLPNLFPRDIFGGKLAETDIIADIKQLFSGLDDVTRQIGLSPENQNYFKQLSSKAKAELLRTIMRDNRLPDWVPLDKFVDDVPQAKNTVQNILDLFRGLESVIDAEKGLPKGLKDYIRAMDAQEKVEVLRYVLMNNALPPNIDFKWLANHKEIDTLFKRLLAEEAARRKMFSLSGLREEFVDLSRKYKPWVEFDPKNPDGGGSPLYDRYRKSPQELYADFVSALFNDPLLVQQEAPNAFAMFHTWTQEKKPEFFDAWMKMQNTDRAQQMKERLQMITDMRTEEFKSIYQIYNSVLKEGGAVKLLRGGMNMLVDRNHAFMKEISDQATKTAVEQGLIDEGKKGYYKKRPGFVQFLDQVERLSYGEGRRFVFMRSMNEAISGVADAYNAELKKKYTDEGRGEPEMKDYITENDMNAYLALRRMAEEKYYETVEAVMPDGTIGEKKVERPVGEPGMLVKPHAQETLDFIKRGLMQDMPLEKVEALNQIHENIQKVWQEQVVDYLIDSRIYAPDSAFIQKAKSNPSYYRFTPGWVWKEMVLKAGIDASAIIPVGSADTFENLIKPRKGSVSQLTSVLPETLRMGAMIIDGAQSNMRRAEGLFTLQRILGPRSTQFIRKASEYEKPQGWDKFTFRHDGENQSYWVKPEVSQTLIRNHNADALAIFDTIFDKLFFTRQIKEILTSKNPAWATFNVLRDTMSMVQNVPGARVLNLTGFANPLREKLGMTKTHSILPFLWGSAKETWDYVARGELTPNVESMIMSGVIGHNKMWGAERIIRDVDDMQTTYKPPAHQVLSDIGKLVTFQTGKSTFNYKQRFNNEWRPEINDYVSGRKALNELQIPDWLRRRIQRSTETERMMREMGARWNLNPKAFENEFVNPVQQTLNFIQARIGKPFMAGLEGYGKMSETLPKILGKKYLDKYGREIWDEMSFADRDAFINHVLRTRVGSPDFRNRGLLYNVYNNLWLFSNASIQGMRASFESAKDSPGEWIWKTMMYDVAPAMLAYGLAYDMPWSPSGTWQIPGGFGTVDWDELKKQFRHISRYDLANYTVAPLFWLGNQFDEEHPELGKLAYAVCPKSHQGQIISNLIFATMDSVRRGGSIPTLAQGIGRQMPFRMETTSHPVISSIMDLAGLLWGDPPVDSWSGRYVVHPKTWNAAKNKWVTTDPAAVAEAVGMVAPELMAGMFNRIFGTSVLRIDATDDEAQERKSVHEWITSNIPGVGPLLNRIVRVSDGRGLAQERAYQANLERDAKQQVSYQREQYIDKWLDDYRGERIVGLPKIQKSDIYVLHKELKQAGIGVESPGTVNQMVKDKIYDMSGLSTLSGLAYDSMEGRVYRLKSLMPDRDITPDNWEEALNDLEYKTLGFALPRSMAEKSKNPPRRPGRKRR